MFLNKHCGCSCKNSSNCSLPPVQCSAPPFSEEACAIIPEMRPSLYILPPSPLSSPQLILTLKSVESASCSQRVSATHLARASLVWFAFHAHSQPLPLMAHAQGKPSHTHSVRLMT
uniref:Uncharacterized protein n=1 Tax=Knipowitschia caucasica TaxID=637954 RepID=A0AAV2K7C7_KNICA